MAKLCEMAARAAAMALLLTSVLAGSSGPVGSPCALAPCKRCGDDGKCAECMPSYGLAYRGYCQPCADPDCADCGEDPSFCTKCNADLVSYEPGGAWPNPGYTTANGTCMWCRAYCNACSDGTGACTRCETLFGMVDGKCQLCLLPDGSENTVDADSLDALYDFEIAKPDACRRCDGDVSRCTACLDGYTLTAGGKCTKCGQYNCAECTKGPDSRCLACKWGMGLDSEGNCVDCADPGCMVCSKNASSCEECSYYGVSRDASGACIKCTEPRCERCPTAPHVCADCGMLISGYGINKLTAACEDCQIDGCSNCESDPSWCDDCQERLILTKTSAGQECTPCAMEGCTRCEQVGDRQICHGCDHERGYAAVERRGWREFTSYVCAYAGAPAPAPGPALQPLDSELANI